MLTYLHVFRIRPLEEEDGSGRYRYMLLKHLDAIEGGVLVMRFDRLESVCDFLRGAFFQGEHVVVTLRKPGDFLVTSNPEGYSVTNCFDLSPDDLSALSRVVHALALTAPSPRI